MNERVEGINPIFGMRITTSYDPLAKGFDEPGLVKALNSISDTRHDYDMLMEAAKFDEVDHYFNPGTEEVADDYVLEAIVVDKFSKTERRMAAVVRVLNKHLADSEINALDAIIGKPRKTGSYAYVTVQLPFSDGQVVSVIFHAPEGDKKKIGPSDQIIAFRWLLNKRDITQVVAPEDGSEISLESLAKRITQLVIKNSARFERTQKEAQAERQELDKAREDLKTAEDRQRELMGTLATVAKDVESIEAKLSNTLALLEKQKVINAELQARLDAMRKTQPKGGNGGKGVGSRAITDAEFQEMLKTAARWRGAAKKTDMELAKMPDSSDKRSQLNKLTTKGDLDAYLMRRYGIDATQARDVSNSLTAHNIPDDMQADISEFIDEPWAKLLDNSGSNTRTAAQELQKKLNGKSDIEIFKYAFENQDQNPFISTSQHSDAYELGRWFKMNGHAAPMAIKKSRGSVWKIFANNKTDVTATVRVEGDKISVESGNLGIAPPNGTPIPSADKPAYIMSLEDILAGKYDADTDKIDSLLDEAAAQAEKAGTFEQYEDLFNRAADRLTELYKKKQEAA